MAALDTAAVIAIQNELNKHSNELEMLLDVCEDCTYIQKQGKQEKKEKQRMGKRGKRERKQKEKKKGDVGNIENNGNHRKLDWNEERD